MGDLEATIKSKFYIEGVPWRPPETLSFCSKSMVWRYDIDVVTLLQLGLGQKNSHFVENFMFHD